jgi:glycerol-3-phosphate dehydrogenase
MPSREEMWARLGGEVDVLIVGGGINGAGIARDAARRGLSVAMVEKDDLASGTSSRSSKLIHGGLRYLESYEFSLVFEAVSERRILLDLAPHLVSPLGFLFPVYKGSRKKLGLIRAGMWLYDGLSLFRSPKIHRSLAPHEVAELEPAVRTEGLRGAPLYYDCATDDARLTLEVALDATHAGATVVTHAKVESFVEENGRIVGAKIRSDRGNQEKTLRAKVVVNATGPWTDLTRAMSRADVQPLLRVTKGVHIVVSHEKLPIHNAVVCFHPVDDRVLFAIPWGDRTYVGTTDTDFEEDLDDLYATADDVRYLIDAANAYFPAHQLSVDDVIATWTGLRPLIAPDGNGEGRGIAESRVSREHQILVGEDGMITVAGGKLTTFRRMSAEVVDTVLRLLRLSDSAPREILESRSDRVPLPGALGWPQDDDVSKVIARVLETGAPVIDEKVASHLTSVYGTVAVQVAGLCAADPSLATPLVEGRPEILAQVDWAVHRELAASVSDVMIRRTQLFFRDVDQGLSAVTAVADRMAELLRWTDEERARSIAEYRAEVERSRRFK